MTRDRAAVATLALIEKAVEQNQTRKRHHRTAARVRILDTQELATFQNRISERQANPLTPPNLAAKMLHRGDMKLPGKEAGETVARKRKQVERQTEKREGDHQPPLTNGRTYQILKGYKASTFDRLWKLQTESFEQKLCCESKPDELDQLELFGLLHSIKSKDWNVQNL
jgi:hypothetical protein